MSDRKEQEQHESAYERMMERVKTTLESAEHRTLEPLEHALQTAREKAVELGELSREEADRISSYVRRDIYDLGEFLDRTGSEMSSWFHMDMELIEARVLDLLSSVADKTRVELARLADNAQLASLYHTGEVAAPGTLKCTECGEHLKFRKTARIPPCPKCHAEDFTRVKEES